LMITNSILYLSGLYLLCKLINHYVLLIGIFPIAFTLHHFLPYIILCAHFDQQYNLIVLLPRSSFSRGSIFYFLSFPVRFFSFIHPETQDFDPEWSIFASFLLLLLLSVLLTFHFVPLGWFRYSSVSPCRSRKDCNPVLYMQIRCCYYYYIHLLIPWIIKK